MGKLYNINIWLEDREVDLLKKHDFSEEIHEDEIDEKDKYILLDLQLKGFFARKYISR